MHLLAIHNRKNADIRYIHARLADISIACFVFGIVPSPTCTYGIVLYYKKKTYYSRCTNTTFQRSRVCARLKRVFVDSSTIPTGELNAAGHYETYDLQTFRDGPRTGFEIPVAMAGRTTADDGRTNRTRTFKNRNLYDY